MRSVGRSATADQSEDPVRACAESLLIEGDQRWQIAQRVLASRHFVRSPLLSRFLLYIVAATIQGRAEEITEHQIGVRVFDRPSSYRTVEDNIVRNYARQLRRRLSDYFATEGAAEPLRIDIPLGGYVPCFLPLRTEDIPQPAPIPIHPRTEDAVRPDSGRSFLKPYFLPRILPRLAGLAVYTVLVFGAAWIVARHLRPHSRAHLPASSMAPLWNTLFKGHLVTYIVPADAGLNLIEDISRRPLPVADYIGGDYATIPLPELDPHSASDLHTQDFTSFVDLQLMVSLARLPQFDPSHAVLCFPRDLRLDDLKNANAVILGSVDSNPWAAIAESHANFRIVDRQGMRGAVIVNEHPRPGEQAEYVSHWNEPSHETFALISLLPNLEGNGHLLVLQGLDVAGTQAAGEALLDPSVIAPILRRATRPDGSLRCFEILLRATSIESSSTGTQVIGSRIY